MPVILTSRDQHDVTSIDDPFLAVGGHDTCPSVMTRI